MAYNAHAYKHIMSTHIHIAMHTHTTTMHVYTSYLLFLVFFESEYPHYICNQNRQGIHFQLINLKYVEVDITTKINDVYKICIKLIS